jgi:hypothetical protein
VRYVQDHLAIVARCPSLADAACLPPCWHAEAMAEFDRQRIDYLEKLRGLRLHRVEEIDQLLQETRADRQTWMLIRLAADEHQKWPYRRQALRQLRDGP